MSGSFNCAEKRPLAPEIRALLDSMSEPVDPIGVGGRALLAWFDVDKMVAGLASLDAYRRETARFRRIREELLAPLRKAERITRWWHR